MKSNKRREFIINYLKKNQSVKTYQLSQELAVTRETVRKDLYELEKEGKIKVMHGGAVLNSSSQELAHERRRKTNQNEKKEIAELAAGFVSEGDVIYLSFGTTAYAVAVELQHLKDLTVVTNSLPIVNLLSSNKNIKIIVPGGILNHDEQSFFGQFSIDNVANIFVNTAFIGCTGIDINAGITDLHMSESKLSSMMIKHAQNSVIIADNTKFSNISINRIANIDEVSCIITDSNVDENYKESLIEKGARIINYTQSI